MKMETTRKKKWSGKASSRCKDKSVDNKTFDRALIDFASTRKEKSIKDLKGKINFREGYDYKSLRDTI